jgi:pimeloyl-ACP methyl ester carboxylesterase
MTTIRKGYADSTGGQIHYRSAGQRRSLPLVLLHQTASDSSMYEALMLELSDSFWIVAPDIPGFGGSPPLREPATMAGYARALYSCLASLDIGSCWLFGHHTGASIAVQMEHDHPGFARKLALSGPTLLSPAQRAALPDRAPPLSLKANGSHLTAVWERIFAKDPEAPLELIQRETLLTLSAAGSYREAYEAVAAQDFAGQLATIRCHTLVLAGDQDSLYEALDESLERLQNGRKHVIPGAGTYVCDRFARELAAILLEFFVP